MQHNHVNKNVLSGGNRMNDVKIYFENETDTTIDAAILDNMKRVIEKTVAEEYDGRSFEVSVTIVTNDKIRALNAEYRGKDAPTDVLSFPQFDDHEEEIPEVCEICLGDVVICEQKAREQAEQFGHSFERELVYLFTHSVLHLLGYDHMEDDEKKAMREREEEIMKQIGLMRQEG